MICDVTDATIANKPVVVMIESLSTEEESNGIGEVVKLSRKLGQAGVGVLPCAVDSKDEFRGLLCGLRDFLRETPIPLILHLNMHGWDGGLVLQSREEVEWKELGDLLIPIHDALKGHQCLMLVCVSSCEGFNALRIALADEVGAPCSCVVGFLREPTHSEAEAAYLMFYEALVNQGKSVNASAREVAAALPHLGFDSCRADTTHQLWKATAPFPHHRERLERLFEVKQRMLDSMRN